MTFFQFTHNNVRRNTRAYSDYFLSSTFAILLFFLYATLAGHPDLLHKGYVAQQVITGMQVAEYITCVFSFFSILYSMGSFLRGRNKEFGIFMKRRKEVRRSLVACFLALEKRFCTHFESAQEL